MHEYIRLIRLIILGLRPSSAYEEQVDKAAHKPLWADLAMAFALVAVCLRVLIPSGYMPVFAANGAPTMVICTGEGAKVVAAWNGQPAAPKSPGDHHHKSKSDCGFSGLAQIASKSEPELTLEPAALVVVARLGPLAGREQTLPLRARPPPQTGPPTQA
jgi:hypothetical protein